MNIRTIEEINKKIESGDATVLTAEEISQLVRDGEEPRAEDVDVVTTGTCGIMSGTAAVLHVPVADPGAFKKAKSVLLNGVPGFPGPCPNEWLGSVDMIVYGTNHSIYNDGYGGGFLFKDLVGGKEIKIEVESIDGEKFESTVTMDDLGAAQMIGTRLAFKNYNSFVNPTTEAVSSIFNAIDMGGPFKGFTFSGCGELNPLQNDPFMKTICAGSKVLLNGAEGLVIGKGTRSSAEKPNMMITADMKNMDPHYLGGFKTGAGPEVFDSVAAAIPVLSEGIFKETFIENKDVKLPVTDIRGRHSVLGFTDYADAWEGSDERPVHHADICRNCEVCIVRERCPTGAYTGTLNTRRCFGCGMCAYSCPYGAFTMETGNVHFSLEGKSMEVPVMCRQSDIRRARELVAELTKRIENRKFLLNNCL
ncbi:Homocysteine biosynthesis enzyme, sulfur-incorporation [anaerobic digester metagenome]